MANDHRLAPRQAHLNPAARFQVERFPSVRPVRGNVERYAQAISAARKFHLAEQDETGQIRFLLQVADLQDHSPAMQKLLDDLVARVAPYIAFHNADRPFATAPRHVLNGPIIIGTQVNDARPIGLSLPDMMLHGLIVGPSGSGKTTVLVQIIRWLLVLRLLVGIIDTKDDFGWLLRRPEVLLIDETTRWNPLAIPPFVSVRSHMLELRDEINTRFFGGQWQGQIIDAALLKLYERTHTPSMRDLVREIGAGAYPREAPQYAQARRSTIERLERFSDEALFTTRADGIPWQTLLDHSFVIRSRAYDDVARFKYDLLTRYTYLAHRAAHITTPRRVFAFDEGNDLLTSQQDGIKTVEPLHHTKQLSREWGIGFLGTSVTLDHLADLATTSTGFTIVLRPNSPSEARAVIRALGLNAQQMTAFLHRAGIGDAFLRTAAWPEVVHVKIAPNTEPKYATTEDINAARERTNRFARSPHLLPAIAGANLSPNTAAVSPKEKTDAQPATPTIIQQEIPATISYNAAITNAERPFLIFVCEQGVATVIETYEAVHVQPMQGNRIQKSLLAKGLLTATRVSVGATRGKQSTALVPSDTAYKILGMTRPRLGRGSGPQHAWILKSLRDRIPHATVEVRGADIGILYNAAEHARLVELLRTLAQREISLNDGDAICVEAENDPSRTLEKNLDRDRDFSLVIVGVRRGQLEVARRIAKRHANAVVVDIFALLDALQENV